MTNDRLKGKNSISPSNTSRKPYSFPFGESSKNVERVLHERLEKVLHEYEI
jgi:hypothetical protein